MVKKHLNILTLFQNIKFKQISYVTIRLNKFEYPPQKRLPENKHSFQYFIYTPYNVTELYAVIRGCML